MDASGELGGTDVDGRFENADGLSAQISESETFDLCLVEQWMQFATGRDENHADRQSVYDAYDSFVASGRDQRELLIGIARSFSFRHRTLPSDVSDE